MSHDTQKTAPQTRTIVRYVVAVEGKVSSPSSAPSEYDESLRVPRSRASVTSTEVPTQTVNEDLAVHVETSPDDDSFAIHHSPLARAREEGVTYKYQTWFWWVLFVPANFVALLIAGINVPYSFLARSAPRLRRALGSRLLNHMMGFLIHPLIFTIREGVTTSAALDALYAVDSYFPKQLRELVQDPKKWGRIPGLLVTWLVSNFPGPQSVLNRLFVVYEQISEDLRRQSAYKSKIRMCTLACGSAEATIFALRDFLVVNPGFNISLTLVDRSGSSLRRAMRLAEHLGVNQHIICIEDDLRNFLETAALSGKMFDIVEMVGFFDYRRSHSIINLSSQVRRVVPVGGMFITANTAPSPTHDEFVVRWLIGWPGLVRRSEDEFRGLQIYGGWKEDEVKTCMEPHRIHTIATCFRRP